MLGLKLIHVSKRGHRQLNSRGRNIGTHNKTLQPSVTVDKIVRQVNDNMISSEWTSLHRKLE